MIATSMLWFTITLDRRAAREMFTTDCALILGHERPYPWA